MTHRIKLDQIVVTPSQFYQLATCPHWIWFDRFGDQSLKGELPALAQKLLDQGVVHEADYIKEMAFQHVIASDPDEAQKETLAMMKAGARLIYQGSIEAVIDGVVWRGRPDLLERREGKSILGDFFYLPIDIKSSHSIHDTHELQLTMYATILEKIQGTSVEEASIVNVDHVRLPLQITKTLRRKTKEKVGEIVKLRQGEKPLPRLSSHCKHSPWFTQCIADAERNSDIALIYNVHSRTLESLRALGIKTVDDAAHMNVQTMPVVPYASPEKLLRIKLQAESLIDSKIIWRTHPNIPSAPLKIYFDIEGDPLLDVQYLFGFWIVGDPDQNYAKIGQVHQDENSDRYFLYFVAEKPEDERVLWNQFLSWIELLPSHGYFVYHFADYERARTLSMSIEHGSSQTFDKFLSKYVDLSKVVQESVIFPLYFYSIKDIAKSKFLNYRWRHKKAGGAQSIFWYEEWLETGDRRVLQDIIDYNEDDVIATEYLHRWLCEHGESVVS